MLLSKRCTANCPQDNCSCPSDLVVVFHKSLWLCFLEKKNNNFHYEIPPGFIFLISSHMLLWLWVKCLQGFCCEATKNIALNKKEFLCFTSWVCSSELSRSHLCITRRSSSRGELLFPSLCCWRAGGVPQAGQCLSVVAQGLWCHITMACEALPASVCESQAQSALGWKGP